jgi:hypothetical protein
MKNIMKWHDFLNENRIDFYPGNKKQVKITGCSDDNHWYKKFIGNEFTVIDDKNTKWKDNKEYWKIVPTEDKKEILGNKWYSVLYIQKDDCEEIN